MRFSLQREVLLKPLAQVVNVVERRQTLPVLANLLVSVADNRLSLTGTDLEVEMVRKEGDDALAVLLPVGSTQCALLLSAEHGRGHGLALIDHRDVTDRSNPVVRRPGVLQNGRRMIILVAVRTKSGQATVEVVRDGKFLIRSAGPLRGLSMPSRWSLPERDRPALGANQCQVSYRRVRLRLVSGEATALPPSQPPPVQRSSEASPKPGPSA